MKLNRFEELECWQESRILVNKEFIQFLYIAKSSAAEVQSIFYIGLDLGYITEEVFNKAYNQADKVSKISSGLIRYLFSQRK